MDIDLFSEMVRNLILDNDEVTLPGLGTFVSEVMPSSFSDKGYTINPPYRRLSFRQRGSGNDGMLAEFYAKVNGMDPDTSRRILDEFIAGLKETLQTKKVVVFPGLGRLRATKENAFFFVADEDLDIYPYGVGLEPVSLKTHEETPDEVTRRVAALRELVEDPMPVKEPITPVTEPIAPVTEPVEVTDGEGPVAAADKTGNEAGDDGKEAGKTDIGTESVETRRRAKNRGWRPALVAVASVIGLAVAALGIFLLLARIAPDFIDSILYTPEELRIINH